MSLSSEIQCQPHLQQAIGKCIQCSQWVCKQCSQQHLENNHQIINKKLIVKEWSIKLKQWIKGLQIQLQQIDLSYQKQFRTRGMNIIDMCKQQILELVQHHFSTLKEEYLKIIQFAEQSSPQKQLSEFIRSKLQQYSKILNKLQISGQILFQLDQTIGNQYEIMKGFIEQKQNECQQHLSNKIQLIFNQQSLLHIGDLLTQTIGIVIQKNIKQSHEIRILKNKEKQIVSFLQDSSKLFLYDIREKKASKIDFTDFTVPLKGQCCQTLSGKIFYIGGQSKVQGKTKYHKQIWQFDKKFNMMRILTLMRTGRSFHSVTYVNFQNEEFLFILGGRNSDRLRSFEKYNISTNTLSQLKQYQAPLACQTGIQIQNKIYYFGGRIGENQNTKVIIYLISQNLWKEIDPINSINYIATLQPIVLKHNSDILLLGGWKKCGKGGYVTNYIQYYSLQLNIFQTSKKLLPVGIFRQSSHFYESDVHYVACQTKRDSNNYGPNMPHIVCIDIIKNKVQLTNFTQC